jgi:uncharacterized protein (TIGR02145 family)
MKNLLTIVLINSIALLALAQAPQKFSYQSVIRNAGNQLVANQTVGIKISILQGTATGSTVYAETHNPLTNANGLATLEIGGGTVLSGNFATINWANGPFFVKTETDLNGSSNYTITNTTQLLSVPYALHANNTSSSVSSSGDTLLIGNQSFIIPGISVANISGGGQTGLKAHTCGVDSVHNPAKTYGTITDQQGNVYKTVIIGNQEWMAENLKTSIYLNGDAILTSNGNYLIDVGAWNYYYNNIQNNCPYGKLYNWHAVADPRKVCPTGWHVPSDAEWSTLINHLDPNAGGGSITPNMAGGKLKSTGSQYWNAPNLDATNESGFSGLAGGSRYAGGPYFLGGMNGEFWSSSQSSSDTAWGRTLLYNLGEVSRSSSDKNNAFSVRCIRD